jgi:hypothetical protein
LNSLITSKPPEFLSLGVIQRSSKLILGVFVCCSLRFEWTVRVLVAAILFLCSSNEETESSRLGEILRQGARILLFLGDPSEAYTDASTLCFIFIIASLAV